jgi:hypothetical protein
MWMKLGVYIIYITPSLFGCASKLSSLVDSHVMWNN